MITILLTVLMSFCFFLLAATQRTKFGLSILIFFFPLSTVRHVEIGSFRSSYLAIAALAFFYGYVLRKDKQFFSKIKKIPFHKVVCLVALMYMLHPILNDFTSLDQGILFYGENIFEAVTRHVMISLAGISIFYLMNLEIYTQADLLYYIRIFVFSIFFLALIIFANEILHFPIPMFLTPISMIPIEANHYEQVPGLLFSGNESQYFAGYHGFLENFAEYLFIIFVFSIILFSIKFKDKKSFYINRTVAIIAMNMSVVMALKNPVKAYPIMLLLFFSLYISSIVKNYKQLIRYVCFLLILFLIFVTLQNHIESSRLYNRFYEFETRYGMIGGQIKYLDDIAILLGRRDLFRTWNDVIGTGGLWGIGPFVVASLNGSNIPYHNLYYQLYLSFGLFGFIVFVLFFAKLINSLRSICRDKGNSGISHIGKIFLFLFIILLAEQIKMSAFRCQPSVLTFWFLFGLFASASNLRLQTNPNRSG